MKHAKISELKAKLSAYIAAVRKGETVLVYDRNTAVARLEPYEEHDAGLQIIEPSRPVADLKKLRGVKLKKPIDVVKLLRESRDQR